MVSRRVIATASMVLALLAASGATGAAAGPERSRPVAPGVVLDSGTVGGAGDARIFHALTVDLTGGTRVGYLDPGRVTQTATLAAMADRSGAVAAVNGDYFDVDNTGAPRGGAVREGVAVKSPAAGHRAAAVIDADGTGRIATLTFTGTATTPDGPIALDGLNSHQIPTDGVGVFTPLWGQAPRGLTVHGAERVAEALVVDGAVTRVGERAGTGPVETGATVLLGREAGAERVAALRPGDAVTVSTRLRADGRAPHTAVGGRTVLLRGGEVADVDADVPNPRSAIGFSADGERMFVVTADGRHAGSRGATLRQMAERLRRDGAWSGLELDGGGSSTLLARTPGGHPRVENRTGEVERAVPNGLAVYAPRGSGEPTGLWVRPVIDPRPAPGPGAPVRADPYLVFTGLRRALVATAHDETFGPVTGPVPEPRWSADRGTARAGSHTAGEPGPATVTARAGAAEGAVELTVLAGPERLEATTPSVALPAESSQVDFAVVGVAPGGARAPIEPADVTVDHDPELVAVEPGNNGMLRATAVAASGSGSITLAAGGASVRLPVRVGSVERVLAAFEDADSWRASAVRATARVAPGEGREGLGLALSYDFGTATATRAAYAHPPAPLAVPGHASALGLWVRGDGGGGLLAATVTDAAGQRRALYGPRVTWTDWSQARIPVPEGLSHPLTVERLYLVETRSGASYSGTVVVDDLTASVTPAGESRTPRPLPHAIAATQSRPGGLAASGSGPR